MRSKIHKRVMIGVAAFALLMSIFIGFASDASADGGGGASTNGVTWCRTC